MDALLQKAQQQADRIEELEQELGIVRTLLKQYQGRQIKEIAERRRAAMNYYREEYQRSGLHPPDHHVSGGNGNDEIDS